MTPLRTQIYSQIENEGTYSIERLANQYRVSEHVIRIHLDKLKEEGKKIRVTDDEVSILLDHSHKFWIFAFWVFVGLVTAVVFLGGING